MHPRNLPIPHAAVFVLIARMRECLLTFVRESNLCQGYVKCRSSAVDQICIKTAAGKGSRSSKHAVCVCVCVCVVSNKSYSEQCKQQQQQGTE